MWLLKKTAEKPTQLLSSISWFAYPFSCATRRNFHRVWDRPFLLFYWILVGNQVDENTQWETDEGHINSLKRGLERRTAERRAAASGATRAQLFAACIIEIALKTMNEWVQYCRLSCSAICYQYTHHANVLINLYYWIVSLICISRVPV